MALTKFVAQQPPSANQRLFLLTEFKRVELSVNALVTLLEAVGKTDFVIEIGPANSAGVGFRALRIPN